MVEKNLPNKTRTVAEMNLGECAVISSIHSGLAMDSIGIRLMEMGFTPGQEIVLIAKSPFDCPLAVAVRGTIIALRALEAQCIHI
jgi:Fe2+ transport system protein FeoA